MRSNLCSPPDILMLLYFQTLKHSKQSMRLKMVGDWIHYITEGGQPFYYNEKNGEFQWESPFAPGLGSISDSSKATTPGGSMNGKPGEVVDGATGNSPSLSKNQSVAALKSPSGHDLPKSDSQQYEWRPYKEPESGALFWYNQTTGVSQWECPYDNPNAEGIDYSGADGTTGAGAKGAEEDHDDHNAEVVHDTDDLGI